MSRAAIWLVLPFWDPKENADNMLYRLGGESWNHVRPTSEAISSIAMLGNIYMYAPGPVFTYK